MKSKWYQWHHIAGIPLAIFLCFVLATGTLSVFSNELDWLANSAIRSESAPKNADIPWPTIYQQALSQASGDALLSIKAPVHNGFAVQGTVKKSNGERYYLYFNAKTGIYQGKGDFFNIKTVLRRLHRHLMMPTTMGITLVCLTSFCLLISVITGLKLQKNWLATLFRKPRTSNARVFWSDVHRTSGLWSIWLILIISLTGVWYLAERWGLEASYPNTPSVDTQNNRLLTAKTFDHIIAQVETHNPDFDIQRVLLNTHKNKPITVEGFTNNLLVRPRANKLIFNPQNGQLISEHKADTLSFHARISEAADPLHFGTWGGYFSKILYFLFGLLLTSLSITGTYIYAMRLSKLERNEKKMTSARWKKALGSMGKEKWINVMLVTTAMFMTAVTVLSN